MAPLLLAAVDTSSDAYRVGVVIGEAIGYVLIPAVAFAVWFIYRRMTRPAVVRRSLGR